MPAGDPAGPLGWSEGIRRGDPEVFEVLFTQFAPLVRSGVAGLVEPHDVDDVTSMVFLEAWRIRGRVTIVDGSPRPWLLAIARNVSRNVTRSRRRYAAALARVSPPTPEPDGVLSIVDGDASRETGTRVRAALEGLPELDRHVVLACLHRGLSQEQAANELGLSVSAVRSRLFRARRQLREQLGGQT